MSVTITHAELEIVEAVATQVISRSDLYRQCGGFKTYVRAILPAMVDGLVLQMHELYAADHIKTVRAQWPADWLEAVKERFAPQWLLRRYPVRYTVHTVNVKAIWQGYKPATDKYGPMLPYVLARVTDDREWD